MFLTAEPAQCNLAIRPQDSSGDIQIADQLGFFSVYLVSLAPSWAAISSRGGSASSFTGATRVLANTRLVFALLCRYTVAPYALVLASTKQCSSQKQLPLKSNYMHGMLIAVAWRAHFQCRPTFQSGPVLELDPRRVFSSAWLCQQS